MYIIIIVSRCFILIIVVIITVGNGVWFLHYGCPAGETMGVGGGGGEG